MNDRNDFSARGTPHRADPVLGNLDQVDAGEDRRSRRDEFVRETPARVPFNTRPQRSRPPRRTLRVPWWAFVVGAVIVIAGGWAYTHPTALHGLFPQTQLNALLTRADQAYAAGKLTGSPDSARDLYEAAQALSPDNEQAVTGLQNVGNAELAKAKTALAAHDYAAAGTALEEARSLLGGGSGVAELNQALAKAELQNANQGALVTQARNALANGQIDGSNGAAALFGKVLAGDPDNAVARHGMNQVGDLLANRVAAQLGGNDRAGAEKTLAQLAALLPGYAQLPTLRAQVAAADRAAAAQRDQYIAAGEADLRAGKVTGAGNDNAEAQFKAALTVDPDSRRAKAGLGQVAAALVVQGNAAIDAGHAQDAKTLLDAAALLAPQSADLAAARSRLAATGQHARTAPASTPATPAPPAVNPADAAKVARLVARAQAAARQGNIMLPPGNSAYDLYRAALAINGDDAAAQAGLRALPAVTRREFDGAVRADNLDKAHDMLATLEQLDPGDPLATSMRHRLGSAWLDRASHYVGLGETQAARAALQEAQRLVPGDPRISEVGARIDHDD
ncbi:MAG TPA: hypothetical protein VFQ95_02505 [Rhodanobacteraceae bacterium]|nr:hypothetical protein [Rhodanobacteraceae bacterium]